MFIIAPYLMITYVNELECLPILLFKTAISVTFICFSSACHPGPFLLSTSIMLLLFH